MSPSDFDEMIGLFIHFGVYVIYTMDTPLTSLCTVESKENSAGNLTLMALAVMLS